MSKSDDLISRQAAIDALGNGALVNYQAAGHNNGLVKAIDVIKGLPSAQPDYDLSGYSDRLWKAAYERGKAEAQRTGRWIWDVYDVLGADAYKCSSCGYHAYGNTSEIMLGDFKFCPNCGAKMEEQE